MGNFPAIINNTLLSPYLIKRISESKEDFELNLLFQIFENFKSFKEYAGEIHTELHLVKPIIRLLSLPYESKPKFFKEGIKDPDYALFSKEEERLKAKEFWGSEIYYQHVLAILLIKRYGRNLFEGISGYFLDFERKIPFYQLLYLLKETGVKWGILTNGRIWIVAMKPSLFEKRYIEIDLEKALELKDLSSLRIFLTLLSSFSLKTLLPRLIEEEKGEIWEILKEKKKEALQSFKGKVEIQKRTKEFIETLFEEKEDIKVSPFNLSEIAFFLFVKKGKKEFNEIERILPPLRTKEELLSLKILDMTPDFGVWANYLLDIISFLSSTLPYKEANGFLAEWEEEKTLLSYITKEMLFGIDRSLASLQILKDGVRVRYGVELPNYRFGNPLLGISIKNLLSLHEEEKQPSLFSSSCEGIYRFIELQRRFFSLSERIKEDLNLKEDIKPELLKLEERIRDVLDLYISSYFLKHIDKRQILELLSHLEDSESFWQRIREKEWFRDVKALSKKYGFFHLEIEFPFFFFEGFDIILINPESDYIFEDERPFFESTKAYIKRATAYIKPKGKIVLLTKREEILDSLSRSKKYEVQIEDNLLLLSLRDQAPSHPLQ